MDATTHEVEALRAEAEKKEVELDQAYQDRENERRSYRIVQIISKKSSRLLRLDGMNSVCVYTARDLSSFH